MTSPGRILIVEDQFFVALDCEMQLRSAGFDCVGLASTSDEAVELACKCEPDLVLMDIRLAGSSDGVQAAIEIYRQLGIRCIFTSGHADPVVREHAQEADPIGWLPKPYTGAELVGAVRHALDEISKPSDNSGGAGDARSLRRTLQ